MKMTAFAVMNMMMSMCMCAMRMFCRAYNSDRNPSVA